jgi:hypothetical protein
MSCAALVLAIAAVVVAGVVWAAVALRGRVAVSYRTEWSIGLYTGVSPLALGPAGSDDTPVLTAADVTDVKASFVADPFLFKNNGTWYLFCEVYNTLANRGQIGLASSKDGRRFTYDRIVLDEPFHVSYPYLFAWDNEIYMVPESAAGGAVRLYRASAFPHSWTRVADLLAGPFCDTSVLRYKDKWWLFACFEPSRHKDLHLFFADSLYGPYREHPKSPVVKGDGRYARPGGRFLVDEDGIVRFAQNCAPTYGKSLSALEITALSETEYQERPLPENPVLTASGRGWNRHGMHHLDAHELADGTWIGAVDGYRKYFSIHVEY